MGNFRVEGKRDKGEKIIHSLTFFIAVCKKRSVVIPVMISKKQKECKCKQVTIVIKDGQEQRQGRGQLIEVLRLVHVTLFSEEQKSRKSPSGI